MLKKKLWQKVYGIDCHATLKRRNTLGMRGHLVWVGVLGCFKLMKGKTMTQHTPGPWHIGKRQPSSSFYIYGPQGEEIADCDPLTQFENINRANARLIAAAPELLAALEWCEQVYGADWPANASIRETIKKAKGG